MAGPSLIDALDAACRAGVRLVMLRERDLTAAELLDFAGRAAAIARKHGARLLINDRVDVALLAAGAAGVHLRASSVPPSGARRLLGPDRLLGVSTHSVADVRRAQNEGADFVIFGPVYATADKARYRPPQGVDSLRKAARAARVPLFAVGGVTPERVSECLRAGAHGVAAMGGLLAAPSIPRRTKEYLRALRRAVAWH